FFFSSRRRHTRFSRDWSSDVCSSDLLPRVVGISQAMEWVATGRVFDAEEALAGGLVSRIEPADGLLAAAHGIAENTSAVSVALRSEERRVGRECRSRKTLARGEEKKV